MIAPSVLPFEWLEADGCGGFASGTMNGVRTRRYHALLLAATMPPAGRKVLVNGCDAWIETPQGVLPLSTQRYLPDVLSPNNSALLKNFQNDPWPTWTFALNNTLSVQAELFVPRGQSAAVLSWVLVGNSIATYLLKVRPFFSGRDFHALHHENPVFQFTPETAGFRRTWKPYPDVPAVRVDSSGSYEHRPCWYKNFLYTEEQARGLDDVEDLAAPGVFHLTLSATPAVMIFSAAGFAPALDAMDLTPLEKHLHLSLRERRRRQSFASPLHRSADAYVVNRGNGKTIIAGYPWFGDWGRDTFIALRGLCLAGDRRADARSILLAWAETVSEGMLPNRFPDQGKTLEYNSVDASLWYVVAVDEYLRAAPASPSESEDRRILQTAVLAVLTGYRRGTRYGIHMDEDGLLAAGEPGVQLTWMDAKIGDWVITPRIGKPVEIQALWINALGVGAAFDPSWQKVLDQARRTFPRKFTNPANDLLYDVIDCGHQPGVVDSSFRPNQIFAVGGLPLSLLPKIQARRMVDAVEAHLLTPAGLRSLDPSSPDYHPRYEGDARSRDSAYHQGTVWPWLSGPFVEAWVRVRGNTPKARAEARKRFLPLLHEQLQTAGLGHLPEITDAETPFTPKGCPFQAWSLGELMRLELQVLKD